MSETAQPHPAGGRIVVGVDGSASSLAAVGWAADEARRRGLGLQLLHADIVPTLTGAAAAPGADGDSALWLQRAAAVAESRSPGVGIVTTGRSGWPVPLLLEEAAGAALVVLGSRGLGGFTGALVGSTAVGVTVHSPVPVVIVRGDGVTAAGLPVVVGVDGSPVSADAVTFAFDAADRRGVPLVAVMSWSDVVLSAVAGTLDLLTDWAEVKREHERALGSALAGHQDRYPDVPVERVLVHDRPVRALLRESERAQLLVVGSRGRGGFAGMLTGSTSHALIYHAKIPLAVVRG